VNEHPEAHGLPFGDTAGSAFGESSPAGCGAAVNCCGIGMATPAFAASSAARACKRPAIKSSSKWIPDRLTMTGLRVMVRFEVCVVTVM
jgi:hypothetical protein